MDWLLNVVEAFKIKIGKKTAIANIIITGT
jgi:hypothetical protein